MNISSHLDKLKPFVAVAEAGTIHEAAKRLHITQPALSRMIRVLEDSCGFELFVRSRQGVSLTPPGKEMLSYARLVLRELENLESKLQTPTNPMAGHIRIGTYESLAEYLWPDFLHHMQSEIPELAISLKTNSEINQLEALARGDIDILVDAEPRLTEELISWPLYKDKFNFFYKAGGITELDPISARDLTLIYVPQAADGENRSPLYHLEAKGYSFSKKMALDSFTTAQSFCAKGIGLAILPTRLQEEGKSRTGLVKLDGFHARGFGEHTICATIRASDAKNYRILEFIKNLKNWFKN
jgi:DNA-binding transcriptional LysR family regulator